MKSPFTFYCGSRVLTLLLEPDEGVVMKAAGEMLLDAPIPGTLEINSDVYGAAFFQIRARGKYVKGGKEIPSMYATCTSWDLRLKPAKYEDAYLTCVNLESNNYKCASRS